MPARDIVETLRDVAAALQLRRWYLFGAQSVVIWGRPRLTTDIDITVEATLDEIDTLTADFARAGFVSRREDLAGFARQTRVLPLLHAETRVPVDAVIAGPGLEEQFLDRVIFQQIGGVQVPVISPEDLIIGKLLSGREKDLEDVRGVVLAKLESLDADRILAILEILEKALSRGDLKSEFERIRSGAAE